MNKILFVPDVHLQEYSPRSRKDNYPTVILDKLKWIVDYANENNCITIFLGDLFNAVNMPLIYLYRVIDIFKGFNKTPFVIQGNHDIPRNDSEQVDRTPLGLLEKAGFISWLTSFEIGGIDICGFHYPQEITKWVPHGTGIKSICVAHAFFEDSFAQDHNLHKEDCKSLGYTYYVLGHDHTPYEDYIGDTYKVLRPGSLSRGTANDKQLTRDEVHILEYDLELDTFTKISVPCQIATEVFKDSVFLRKEEEKPDTQQILDKLVFTSNDNIYDVLDNADQPEEIKDIVIQYLESAGIFRINKN